jgi:hypothetical protein
LDGFGDVFGGGPWRKAPVQAGVPSDPFPLLGFERKALHLISSSSVAVDIEFDVLGNGTWVHYDKVNLAGAAYKLVTFPDACAATGSVSRRARLPRLRPNSCSVSLI